MSEQKKGIWDYVFANMKGLTQRVRHYVKAGTSVEVASNIADFSVVVTTDATGAFTVDYTPMGFLEILHVSLTVQSIAKAPANSYTVELVGDPTTKQLTLQVIKPINVVLASLPVAAATSAVKVYVNVRGRIA